MDTKPDPTSLPEIGRPLGTRGARPHPIDIRRVNPPEHLLGDMAYDGDELREELERHRTKSVIPNRPNRRHWMSDRE